MKVVLGGVAVLVVGWSGYQAYLHVGDARATDRRLDAVAAAWTAVPADQRAPAAEASTLPESLSGDPFRQMGTTTFSAHWVEGSTVVIAVQDGTCGAGDEGHLWQAAVRESDDLVVVLVRPPSSWLPDIPGAVSLLRGDVCAGVGIDVSITVPLERPLGTRLLVDAGSGRVSSAA
jgi:hypothetical protein